MLGSSNQPIGEVLAFDISKSGMFIQSPVGDYYGLKVGDRIAVRWVNQNFEQIERDATVVRTAEAAGKYPHGLGVQFDVAVSSSGF